MSIAATGPYCKGFETVKDKASHVAKKQKDDYQTLGIKGEALLPANKPNFDFPLKEKHITVMGELAKIDLNTWKKIVELGKQFLIVTNQNWYQSNDFSFTDSASIARRNKALLESLKPGTELRSLCQGFVEKCPSKWYRVIVRLALEGVHWNSGCIGESYENHSCPY